MASPSVTHGTFSDYRRVKTRSVVQVTIEIPMERWDEALKALGGSPIPGKEPWVAVALLKEEPKPEPAKPDVMRSMVGKERYANADEQQKAVARSALLCADRQFRQWVTKVAGWNLEATDAEAAGWMRQKVGVKSRAEIGTDEGAYQAFLDIERWFHGDRIASGHSPHLTGQRS